MVKNGHSGAGYSLYITKRCGVGTSLIIPYIYLDKTLIRPSLKAVYRTTMLLAVANAR